MDLSRDWEMLEQVAQLRLAHNKTARHVSRYGEEIELMGVAGELAARRFLGLPEELHLWFDGGADLTWKGWRVDVKATRLTPFIEHRYLQWPVWKPMKADIVLLTAVDLGRRQATVVGWAWGHEVVRAPVNEDRYQPCHEIPIPELMPLWALYSLPEKDDGRACRARPEKVAGEAEPVELAA